jgi:hypothetical protein
MTNRSRRDNRYRAAGSERASEDAGWVGVPWSEVRKWTRADVELREDWHGRSIRRLAGAGSIEELAVLPGLPDKSVLWTTAGAQIARIALRVREQARRAFRQNFEEMLEEQGGDIHRLAAGALLRPLSSSGNAASTPMDDNVAWFLPAYATPQASVVRDREVEHFLRNLDPVYPDHFLCVVECWYPGSTTKLYRPLWTMSLNSLEDAMADCTPGLQSTIEAIETWNEFARGRSYTIVQANVLPLPQVIEQKLGNGFLDDLYRHFREAALLLDPEAARAA